MIKPRTAAAAAHWQVGALCAALSALIGLLLLVLPLGDWMAHLSYDSGFWRRADIPVNEATIVYMDDESHRLLAQPWNERWDRALHARLIERLTTLGARVIVFDILFAEPGQAEADARLVAAAKAHGRVAVAAIQFPHLFQGERVGWEVKRAFPGLTDVAASGIVEQSGEDKAVRRHYFIAGQTVLPSLAWRAAELASSSPPPTPARERWVNYYGPPGFLPHLSYFEVLDPKTSIASLISNKVVFVGALYSVGFTGGKSSDDFRNPYTLTTGRLSPGVEINATCYLNLVRRDWLTRLPPVAEAGLMMVFGAMFGFGLAPLRPVRACIAGALGATMVGLVATWSAWQAHVWFPWMIVALAQMPLALACSVFVHSRRLTLERRAFEQALALASEGRVETTATAGASSTTAGSPASPAAMARAMTRPDFLRPAPSSLAAVDLPAVPDHDLVRCIGQGAYGEVWLARDLIGSFHAVKLLRLESFKSAAPMETEFEGLRKFTPISRSHPGFVHILHVGRDPSKGCLFYVMELADDESAGAKVDPQTYTPRTLAGDLSRRGRLPLSEVVQLGIRLADALEHLHRHQLIHRDIKPANILFVKGEPKFADIGLVTDVAAEGETAGHLGTPGRMAPEGPGSPAADVFSLGKLLYEAGLGMEVERFPELPRSMIESGTERALFDFNRVILRACEVDPRRRYRSAAELRDELAGLQQRLSKTP